MGSIVSSVADVFGMGPSSIQAGATRDAANTSANAQLQAARIAADAAKFRPVGITSRFGSSTFGFDGNGNLTSAGYQLTPELQAMQDQIMGYTRQGLGDIGTLQALGRGYLAQSPQQAAADWMSKQQALLQPSRQQQYSQMQQNLFNTGRGGLSVAQGGNLGAANPEMQAYYNALAQQDAQLAAQAQQAGQQQTQFGLGLLSSAYAPFQTGLGLGSTIEQLGQTPLDLGAQLGGRAAQSGATQAQALLQGGLGAAKTLQAANQLSPMAAGLYGLGQSGLGTALDNRLLNAIGVQTFNPNTGWSGGGSGTVNVPGEGLMSIGGYFNKPSQMSWYD